MKINVLFVVQPAGFAGLVFSGDGLQHFSQFNALRVGQPYGVAFGHKAAFCANSGAQFGKGYVDPAGHGKGWEIEV
jgi:hypothetical protein